MGRKNGANKETISQTKLQIIIKNDRNAVSLFLEDHFVLPMEHYTTMLQM